MIASKYGLRLILIFTVLCLTPVSLISQTERQDTTAPAAEAPRVFTASETAAESEETASFLAAAKQRSQPRAVTIQIQNNLPNIEEDTKRLVEKIDNELQSQISLTDMGDFRNSLQRQDGLLRDLRDQLRNESSRLEEFLSQIRSRRESWKATEEASRENEDPKAVMDLISQVLEALNKGLEEIGEQRSRLLSLQNSIVALRGLIQASVNKVTEAEDLHRQQLFSFSGPPIWRISQADTELIWPRVRDQFIKDSVSFRDYASTRIPWILLSLFFLIVATLLLRSMRHKLKDGLDESEELLGTVLVLEHPFTSSIVLVTFVSSIFHTEAPHSWYNATLLIGLVALFRLLPVFVPKQLSVFAFLLLGLRTLVLIDAQIPEQTILGRFLTVFIIFCSIIILTWFRLRFYTIEGIGQGWKKFLYLVSWLGITVLGVALLAGFFGNLILAGLLAGGVVRTAFLATSYWLAFTVFRGMLVLSLQSQIAQKFRFIRGNRDLVFQKTIRIIGAITVLAFLLFVPHLFSVFEPISSAVVDTITEPLKLGALSLSLADIIVFVFLVWLSFQISRFICFVLEEDFLPRFTFPRGVPATISRLTYYGILFFGFIIALTAAGFELSNVTLLAGAFGVGIGFGLQNIVNNFVSGLILLFERPVHIGDKIQLAQDLTGEVVRIGIRASVVRTFDGAEVLVPNGHLISNELTNWTLSDPKRRITIPIGVAYGTDPEQVVEILKRIASNHPEVLDNPEPAAHFMAFGESSLDFSLRVWVANFESGFQVKSDLTIAINKALKEAEIEIPFPQRDLHLRSVTEKFKIQKPVRKIKKDDKKS